MQTRAPHGVSYAAWLRCMLLRVCKKPANSRQGGLDLYCGRVASGCKTIMTLAASLRRKVLI